MKAQGEAIVQTQRKKGGKVAEEVTTEHVVTDFTDGDVELGLALGHTVGLEEFSSFRVTASIKFSVASADTRRATLLQEKWLKARLKEVLDAEGLEP